MRSLLYDIHFKLKLHARYKSKLGRQGQQILYYEVFYNFSKIHL